MITDILLEQAINYAEEHKGCSLAGLMRDLGLSLNKASMLLDVMTAEGIVEDFNGDLFRKFLSRGRDVFK